MIPSVYQINEVPQGNTRKLQTEQMYNKLLLILVTTITKTFSLWVGPV